MLPRRLSGNHVATPGGRSCLIPYRKEELGGIARGSICEDVTDEVLQGDRPSV